MSQPPSLPSMTADEIPAATPRTTSLAAAAAMNAGLQRESSNEETHSRQNSTRTTNGTSPNLMPRSPSERQRNSITMNLNLNDPALPAPGELQTTSGGIDGRSTSRTFNTPPMASPGPSRSRSSSVATGRHHGRHPSVGEVYQEMEQEQEAQVNRLLQTIRIQQQQLDSLRARTGSNVGRDHSPELPSPSSERRPSLPFANVGYSPHPPIATAIRSRRQSTTSPAPVRSVPHGYQLSHSISSEQENAILPSGQATPALPTPTSSVSGAIRDEVAFYQAEAQNLSRENMILKARIRELERQVSAPQSSLAMSAASMLDDGPGRESSAAADEDIAPDEIK